MTGTSSAHSHPILFSYNLTFSSLILKPKMSRTGILLEFWVGYVHWFPWQFLEHMTIYLSNRKQIKVPSPKGWGEGKREDLLAHTTGSPRVDLGLRIAKSKAEMLSSAK